MSLTCTAYHFSAGIFFKKCAAVLWAICLNVLFFLQPVTAQLPGTIPEQQAEQMAESNGDNEIEDDSFLQQMEHYSKHPLNLNAAGEEELNELKLLSPLQVENFLAYRSILGKLIDVYELQAIPGWDIQLLALLRPYITVEVNEQLATAVKGRLRNGEHNLLMRLTQVLEKAKGYTKDTAGSYYSGSPQKILVRYKYQFKNLLQYGVVAEKDAGEEFFKGSQKQGFDFYSAHFFIRNAGIIQTLAIGDFSVNMGQGLVQWQGMAAKKNAGVMNIKQQSAILRPYNAAGEINFHRGAGITVQRQNAAATFFVSYRNTDATMVRDTSEAVYISSLQTSGYHRTKSEIAGKAVQGQFAFGGNINYAYKNFHAGINAVHYNFRLPLKKDSTLYNLYALAGTAFGNYSLDYSYTFRNVHGFGEAAFTNKGAGAVLAGMLISTASTVDISMFYRNISPRYQSLYASAFTENTNPSGEKGLYMGLTVHPGSNWRLDAYADFCVFPWLRYRIDAPSANADYLLQVSYTPSKQLEIYSRWRMRSGAASQSAGEFIITPVSVTTQKNWRVQLSFKVSPQITWRARTELVWNGSGNSKEQGFIGYTDLIIRPLYKKWTVNGRLQFSDADSYNSRVYSFENDVPYSFSSMVFYEKGYRFYLNSSYTINEKISIWVKLAQTRLIKKRSIGTGPDELSGNHKTEFKLQFQYKF